MTHPHSRAENLRFALRVAGLLAKGFAALLTLLLLLAAGVYFALPHLVDAQRVRAYLESGLQQALARPVSIENVIVTPQGIKLANIRILEPDGGATFIESDFALVTIRLGALAERRIELSNVRLASPRIKVYRDHGGRWSFEDLFTSTAPTAFVLPVSLAAEQLAIESGRLEIEDRPRGRHFTVDRFNLSLRQFDLEAPFSFSVSFDNVNVLGQRRIAGALSLEGEANLAGLDWPQASLRADEARLEVDGRALKGTFSIKGFPLAAVEASLNVPTLGVADLERWLQRPVDFALPAARCRLRAQMLETTRLRVDELAWESGPASARAGGVVDWITGSPVVSIEASLENFPLDQAAAFKPAWEKLGLKGQASAEATVTGSPGRWVVGKAHVRLRGAEARFARWSVLRGDGDITASDDFGRVALTLSGGAVRAFNNEFRDITTSLKLTRKDLQVDYLGMKWEGSRLRVRGRVVNLPDPKDVWIAGTLDVLEWERAQKLVADLAEAVAAKPAGAAPLAPTQEPRRLWVHAIKYSIPSRFPDTIGRIRVGSVRHKNFSFQDTDLFWDIHGVTPRLDTVNGEVRVAFGPGRINDIQAVQDSHKFLKIVFLPYIYMHKMNSLSVLSAARAYPTSLDFNRIEGQYGIQKGAVKTRFSEVDSPQLLAYADGTADFARESVDMNILTRLTSYRAPLPEWWVDEKGRPAIGFRVKGDLNSPELEPRLHKIGATELENTMADGRRRAKERFEAMAKLEQLEAANDAKGANR